MSCEVWAVLAGTVVGAMGTVAANWLTNYLTTRPERKLNERRKALLKTCLEGAQKAGWMNVKTLAQLIGADLDTTRTLLLECDARGSLKIDKEMWSLISRNGLPTGEE